jgi:hypothetical protein
MPKTLAGWLAELWLRHRLNSRVRRRRALPPSKRRLPMNLSFLSGYKTYIVAAAMILFGLSQLVGVDIPSFEGQSAGHLLMEGLAIIFLRKGIQKTGS